MSPRRARTVSSPTSAAATASIGTARSVQHGNLAYVGTYGNVALGGVANLFSLLGGSAWQITDPNRAVILDAVEQVSPPFIVNSLMMDCVSSRPSPGNAPATTRNGHGTTSVCCCWPVASPSRTPALPRRWPRAGSPATASRPTCPASIPEISRAKAVLDDTSTAPAPRSLRIPVPATRTASSTGARAGPSRSPCRPKRMARYEWGNGENLRGGTSATA